MKLFTKTILVTAIVASCFSANFALASENETQFFGNLRVGAITVKDDAGERTDGSAIGGHVGVKTASWNGLSVGATAYGTTKLFDDENGEFFGSDGKGYAILGEAYLQGDFGNTQLKLGRFGVDTPHADTDDIRMVPNTFTGVLITNTDFSDTTLYLAHLDEWSGVDSDIPEEFTEMNADNGITTVGAAYAGFENMELQAWYYHSSDLASLVYVEGIYEKDNFSIGAQYGSQSDKTADGSGPDGDVFGLMATYTFNDVTFSTAYNKVDGVIVNGFGGGPFFTSSDDHTIEGEKDQSGLALGAEYTGIDGLTLGVINVNFEYGEDETDFYAAYDIQDNINVEMVFHTMGDEGEGLRIMFNYNF